MQVGYPVPLRPELLTRLDVPQRTVVLDVCLPGRVEYVPPTATVRMPESTLTPTRVLPGYE